MLNIAIRVDAATHIGTGHVMRCLTLADRLKQQSNILFVCKAHSGHIAALIEEKGYAIAWLTCQENDTQETLHHANWLGGSQQDDAEQTLNALAQYFDTPVDWVIVDHYALDKTWERCFRHTRVFVIDDLGDRKHHADILLDQNLQASTEKYQHLVNPDCTLLLGLKYALLRQEFYISEQEIIERRQSHKIERILVMFGGIDPDNLTQQVIDQLVHIPEIKHIDVIVTKSAAHLAALQAQNKTQQQVQLHVSPESIPKLMLQADLAVGAGGSTSWERCMLALPTITICQAYNQQAIIQAMHEEGIVSVLDIDHIDQLIEHIHDWQQPTHYEHSIKQALALTVRQPFSFKQAMLDRVKSDQKHLSILSKPEKPHKKILYLSHQPPDNAVLHHLIDKGCEIHYTCAPIKQQTDYDLIISFGYRHIIPEEVVAHTSCPIINLHISYLPYNKGAHPNFWSFYDNTPSGVTIHLIDHGIDTGEIILRKRIDFDATQETFFQTYTILMQEIQTLFIENIDYILGCNWNLLPQKEQGTIHYTSDLPKIFSGWDALIAPEIQRLHKLKQT